MYINSDTQTLSDGEKIQMMRFYSEEERTKIKCAQIEIEQKENIDLDFNDRMNVHISGNPLETFINISKVLFSKFFANVEKSENSCQIYLK